MPIYQVVYHLNKFTLYIIESNLIVKSSKYFNNPEFETFISSFLSYRPVEDFLTDEIQLYIFNQEQENGAEKPQPDKHHLLPRSVSACINPSMLNNLKYGE